MRIRSLYALLATLMLSVPFSLCAEPTELDMLDDLFSMDLETLQNISVSSVSKMDEPVKNAPANMRIFTQEEIETRGWRCVADLLQTLPGVAIHNFSTSGYFNAVNIRGINGAHYFKILLDGVEIDQTNGEMISTAMNFPLHGIERVEVIYGPASVIYGADAVSGVINLVTEEQVSGALFFSAADEGYTYDAMHVARQFGDFRVSLRGHYHRDQEYKFDERYPEHFPAVDIVDSSGAIIQPANARTFDFEPSSTESLNFRLSNGMFDIGVNYSKTTDSTLLGQVDDKSYENLFDRDANIATSLLGAYGKYHLQWRDLQLNSTLSYDRTTVEEGSYFINDHTDYNKAYKYSRSERYAFEQTANLALDDHQILLGASYEHFKSMPMSFDMPAPSPSGSYTYPGTTIPINYYERSWDNAALFAQDYYHFTSEWKSSLALRYDHSTVEGNIFNPRLALIYQPGTTTHKLIYSEAYLSPSMNSKYKHYGVPFSPNDGSVYPQPPGDTNAYITPYFRVPNGELEAEESRTLEYALFTHLPRDVFLQASLYYTKLDNLISERNLDNVNATDLLSDMTLISIEQFYNSGYGIFKGADISLNYSAPLFEATANYWFNYSYVDGYIHYQGLNYELPFIAPHQVNAGVTLKGEEWSIAPSLKWLNHLNAHYIEDIEGGNTEREHIKGYTLVDLFATYRLAENVTASLRVTNLLDRRYYNARDGFSSTYAVPQPGRIIIAGLKARF